MNMEQQVDKCIYDGILKIPGIESVKKTRKGMLSSTGPIKQGFEVGNSCFTKCIPGPMVQFIMALRWALFFNSLEACHSRLYRWVFEAYNIFKV